MQDMRRINNRAVIIENLMHMSNAL